MGGREKQRTLLVCPLVGPFYLSSVDQMVGGWGEGGARGRETKDPFGMSVCCSVLSAPLCAFQLSSSD